MAGRRAGRRTALFLLYQWDVTGQPLTSLYEGEVDEFARGLAEAVSARAPELDAAITAAAEGWTADRLGAVERNVLRIGTYELEAESVPPEVAMPSTSVSTPLGISPPRPVTQRATESAAPLR